MKREECFHCEYYRSRQPCVPENKNCQCFPLNDVPVERIEVCPKVANPNYEQDFDEWCEREENEEYFDE